MKKVKDEKMSSYCCWKFISGAIYVLLLLSNFQWFWTYTKKTQALFATIIEMLYIQGFYISSEHTLIPSFPGLGLSASYTVLLTWLLSMVPENYDFLIKKPEELEQVPFYPPFYVLGMQQLWMDEDLCLVVAVTPHPLCDTKGIPNKQKKSKTKVLFYCITVVDVQTLAIVDSCGDF